MRVRSEGTHNPWRTLHHFCCLQLWRSRWDHLCPSCLDILFFCIYSFEINCISGGSYLVEILLLKITVSVFWSHNTAGPTCRLTPSTAGHTFRPIPSTAGPTCRLDLASTVGPTCRLVYYFLELLIFLLFTYCSTCCLLAVYLLIYWYCLLSSLSYFAYCLLFVYISAAFIHCILWS